MPQVRGLEHRIAQQLRRLRRATTVFEDRENLLLQFGVELLDLLTRYVGYVGLSRTTNDQSRKDHRSSREPALHHGIPAVIKWMENERCVDSTPDADDEGRN